MRSFHDPLRRSLLVAVPAAAMLMSGCATWRGASEPAGGVGTALHPLAERTPERWRAIGRIAASAGEGRWRGSFDWRQTGEQYRLDFSGPMGQGALRIEREPNGGVMMTTAEGERTRAATPEALLRETLGWDLPVTSLRHWITGRARPGAAVDGHVLDRSGRYLELRQQQWRLRYQYELDEEEGGGPYVQGSDADALLPARLLLESGEVRVRIVVREWRLDPPT